MRGLWLLAEKASATPRAAGGIWDAAAAHWPLVAGLLAGAVSLWLMVPPGRPLGRRAGRILGAVALVLLAAGVHSFGPAGVQVLFWLMAGIAVASACVTISVRSPVYSAIWFAVTLLATAGLFLLQGAQLLSLATVIVYAGAIVVMFLFVLMLAQPEGHAYYDRMSWGPLAPLLATICGLLLAGSLVFTVERFRDQAAAVPHQQTATSSTVLGGDHHTARLGGRLYSRHLVAVEAAGTLLLVALVGAIAIVIQSRQGRAVPPPLTAVEQGDAGDG